MTANLYIIAGPNGAGKTTFATDFLPKYGHCKHFVNADLIAKGVSPFSPESAAFRAGRIMLDEIELLSRQGENFGIETTLSGKTLLNVIRKLQRRGYVAHLHFLWVPNEELALSRIRGRVMRGGHDVATEIVHRRFARSISNFFRYYRGLADSWILFDNSGETPSIIAFQENKTVRIMEERQFKNLLHQYGNLDEQ